MLSDWMSGKIYEWLDGWMDGWIGKCTMWTLTDNYGTVKVRIKWIHKYKYMHGYSRWIVSSSGIPDE